MDIIRKDNKPTQKCMLRERAQEPFQLPVNDKCKVVEFTWEGL